MLLNCNALAYASYSNSSLLWRHEMADHPVRRKLQRDVLPYLVSACRLRTQWFYRLHVVFGYTTDLVVALTAIGVTTPLLRLFGGSGATETAGQKVATLAEALATIPYWLYYPTGVLVILWVVLRVAFTREEGQKRAVLAKSCTQVLREAEAKLPRVLGKPDPMPDLNELLERQIASTVDRNIQEKAWPWTPFAPNIDDEVDQDLARLCTRYELGLFA
jgi:hypothetical protein